MVRILFVCHGNILKRVRKPGKIKGLREVEDLYYTTTTPFEKELNQLKEEYQ